MIKLKEILFLKNLKKVGKATIYKKYWEMLEGSDGLFDLASEVEMTGEFQTDEIRKAMDQAERLYDEIVDSQIDVITVFDDKYPKKLDVMGNKKPLVLYLRGNIDALTKPNIAVIGTRKPSKLSKSFEENMVRNIVNTTEIIQSLPIADTNSLFEYKLCIVACEILIPSFCNNNAGITNRVATITNIIATINIIQGNFLSTFPLNNLYP